jgi:hypothetical protein
MLINLSAFASLLALAVALGWIKSAPWSRPRHGATQTFKQGR